MKNISSEKKAFTLAEVLITLVIIGVIAALTVPNMIQNYQWHQYKSSTLKVISMLNQSINNYKMEFGVNPDCYYGYDIASNFSNCGQLLDFMRKHFAIQKYCTSNSYQNGCIPDYHGVEKVYQDNNAGKTEDEAKSATTNCDGFWTNNIKSSTGFITNDGTIFIMYNQGFVALYLVDVNGFKGPNKWGYDLRTFTLSKNLKGNMKYMPRYCTQVEKGGKSTKDLLNI